MRVSLIVTTYNWKEALRRTLESALAQTRLPDEIVVADDGSRPDTGEMVQLLASSSPVPIHHCWQEDKGFRLARSRNRAIATATGEYIVLIDGDIVLESHFLADHCAFAHPGQFVQGPRVLLDKALTAKILAQGIMRVPFFARGIGNRKNCVRSVLLARLFSRTSQRLVGIKGCNLAFWRRDVVAVNGFNEEFASWGREDSEFVVRLFNAGIWRRNLRFHALGYHLHHSMSTREGLDLNDRLLRVAIEEKLVRCAQGIDQHLR